MSFWRSAKFIGIHPLRLLVLSADDCVSNGRQHQVQCSDFLSLITVRDGQERLGWLSWEAVLGSPLRGRCGCVAAIRGMSPPPDEHNFGCNCMAGVETNRVAI